MRRATLARFALAPLAGGAVAMGVVQAMSGQDQPPYEPHPDSQLPEPTRNANYQAAVATAQAQAEEYVEAFEASGRDPRSLAPIELMVFQSVEFETLEDTVRAASQVVVGTVSENRFVGGLLPGNYATINVETTLKGSEAPIVEVYQLGGPTKFEDHEFLAAAPGGPLLLEGDRVILLLRPEATAAPDVYSAYPFVGYFHVDGGRVQPAEGHPQAATLTGIPEASLIDRIAAAASTP